MVRRSGGTVGRDVTDDNAGGAGADEVSITWGAYLALAGCLVVLGAALARERALAQAQGAHHAAVVARPEA